MSNLTDDAIARYADAAGRLDPDTLRDALDYADRIAPHPDDAADGAPRAIIALADAGGPRDAGHVRAAVRAAVTSATRDRIRRETVCAPVAPDTMTDRTDDTPRAQAAPTWETVRPTLAPVDRAILDTLAGDGLDRLIRDRVRTHRTMPDGHAVGDAVTATVTGERRALRVSTIAQAVGAPAPRTRDASDALRAAACVAWARTSVALGTAHRTRVPVPSTGAAPRWTYLSETVQDRAVRAMRYVTTDAASLAASWRADRDLIGGATPGTVSPDTVRRLGFVAPVADPVAGSLTRSLPEPRKGAARRSRKGVSVPSTSTRYAGGIAPGAAHGAATVAGVGTDAGILAHVRAARAAAEVDLITGGAVPQVSRNRCGRPMPDGTCGCGGAQGATLWEGCHPLTPCPVPVERRGAQSCGCGRKRGALVEHGNVWHHRAR